MNGIKALGERPAADDDLTDAIGGAPRQLIVHRFVELVLALPGQLEHSSLFRHGDDGLPAEELQAVGLGRQRHDALVVGRARGRSPLLLQRFDACARGGELARNLETSLSADDAEAAD